MSAFANLAVGLFGYAAFIGVDFSAYFLRVAKDDSSSEIAINFLNMFDYLDAMAFVFRLIVFMMLLVYYPMLNLFARTHVLNIFYRNRHVRKRDLFLVNIFMTAIPLLFSLLAPNIGMILTYTGAFGGFFSMYLLPVAVYLKKRYT